MGPPGSLPRRLAFAYCELTRRELEYVSLSRDTTETDLKQRREIVAGTVHYVNQVWILSSYKVDDHLCLNTVPIDTRYNEPECIRTQTNVFTPCVKHMRTGLNCLSLGWLLHFWRSLDDALKGCNCTRIPGFMMVILSKSLILRAYVIDMAKYPNCSS